jgi:hypothetical protein
VPGGRGKGVEGTCVRLHEPSYPLSLSATTTGPVAAEAGASIRAVLLEPHIAGLEVIDNLELAPWILPPEQAATHAEPLRAAASREKS